MIPIWNALFLCTLLHFFLLLTFCYRVRKAKTTTKVQMLYSIFLLLDYTVVSCFHISSSLSYSTSNINEWYFFLPFIFHHLTQQHTIDLTFPPIVFFSLEEQVLNCSKSNFHNKIPNKLYLICYISNICNSCWLLLLLS